VSVESRTLVGRSSARFWLDLALDLIVESGAAFQVLISSWENSGKYLSSREVKVSADVMEESYLIDLGGAPAPR